MTPARTPAAGQEDGDRPGEALRARPTSVRRRGIVELQLPLALLRELHADLYAQGGWAGVIADIMRQYDEVTEKVSIPSDEPAEKSSQPGDDNGHGGDGHGGDGHGGNGHGGNGHGGNGHGGNGHGGNSRGGGADIADPGFEGRAIADFGAGQSAEAGSGGPAADHRQDPATGRDTTARDERRRFPKTRLRRQIEIRDRVCSHPGCRAPATRSEMDHTRQYANGGPTTEHNLAAACAHDHDLRDNGWQVIQTSPGHLTWISRTGHTYPVQPPPIIESLPEPFAPNGWTTRGADTTGIQQAGGSAADTRRRPGCGGQPRADSAGAPAAEPARPLQNRDQHVIAVGGAKGDHLDRVSGRPGAAGDGHSTHRHRTHRHSTHRPNRTGLAVSGYGAGSITDPANDELPFLPTWNYEPAWWEQPVQDRAERAEAETPPVPLSDPADDIPPF
ncbi:HNH endonuclease signature motif containing protein [Microtetraspora glauca]|uniref:HNH endonuclease signature motif containing protein n=1 Tax=Microtetraspora glauca TaxID=1996 RepID=A0ABV3GS42_MICGL